MRSTHRDLALPSLLKKAVTDEYRITRHPILIGAGVVWSLWLILMNTGDHWHLFKTDWFMSITMVFGSFIAGATSEGGGAVAFPVMTLMFKIKPVIARDFSLMIQSVGMIAAAFTIICLKVRTEWRAVLYAGLGGAFGMILGMDVVFPLMPPAFVKVFFTSAWLSFGVALYLMNRHRDREVLSAIENFSAKHASMLFVVGVLGGCVSGVTGSGLDIVTFSLLVLCFRMSEKVATPTSVVLMGINALIGFLWRQGVGSGMQAEAWNYWYVCIPIVVVGAPAGAWFIKNRSRLYVAGFLYSSILAQYVAALLILPMTTQLVIFSLVVFGMGSLLFRYMVGIGAARLGSVQLDSAPGSLP
jgi:uncharacterized membrane protein YfcA